MILSSFSGLLHRYALLQTVCDVPPRPVAPDETARRSARCGPKAARARALYTVAAWVAGSSPQKMLGISKQGAAPGRGAARVAHRALGLPLGEKLKTQ